MDFLALLQQYVDWQAMLVAIVITQAIKYLLPSDPAGSRWSVTPIVSKFMPVLPLIFATATIIIKDSIICNGGKPMPMDDAVIKGLISGGVAGYLYRTTQVVLFSK